SASLAIAGLPPPAGFFSKDEILWQAFSSPYGTWCLWLVGVVVAGMTAFYMFRQVFMVFFGECRADHETQHHLHESPAVMTTPLWILAGGSVLAGHLGIPHPSLFQRWLGPVMGHHAMAEAAAHGAGGNPGLEFTLMVISVLVAATGVYLAYLMYYRRSLRPETFSEALGGAPYRVVFNKYYVDELYGFVFVGGGLMLCRFAAWFDANVIDRIVNLSAAVVRVVARITGLIDNYVVDGAVNAVADTTQFVGRRVRNVQTGAISAYLYVVVLGVLGGVLLYWSWASAS